MRSPAVARRHHHPPAVIGSCGVGSAWREDCDHVRPHSAFRGLPLSDHARCISTPAEQGYWQALSGERARRAIAGAHHSRARVLMPPIHRTGTCTAWVIAWRESGLLPVRTSQPGLPRAARCAWSHEGHRSRVSQRAFRRPSPSGGLEDELAREVPACVHQDGVRAAQSPIPVGVALRVDGGSRHQRTDEGRCRLGQRERRASIRPARRERQLDRMSETRAEAGAGAAIVAGVLLDRKSVV